MSPPSRSTNYYLQCAKTAKIISGDPSGPRLSQKNRNSPQLPSTPPYCACVTFGGGALARCIVVVVVPPDLGRSQSRDTAAPRPHPSVSHRGAAFKLVSCFFLGKGRKPKRPGAELRRERTPARPPLGSPYVLVRLRPLRASPESPRRAAAAAALAEGGGGEASPRLPRPQRNGGDRSGHPAADHQAAEPQ